MRRWLLRLGLAVAVLVAVGLGAAWWLLATGSGARFLAGRATGSAPGILLEGVDGALVGGLSVKRIDIDRPGLRVTIHDLELDAIPMAGGLDVRRLSARLVEVRTAPSNEPAKMPESIVLPYAMRLQDGRVAELRLGRLGAAADAPADVVVRDVRLKGDANGDRVQVESLAAGTPYGNAQLAGTIATSRPFKLKAKGELSGARDEGAYRVGVDLAGSLAAFEAKLEGELGGTRATGRAAVEPFATVPVRSLVASVKGLDPAKVSPGAPHAALDVEVNLTADARAYAGPVRVANASPGTIDGGGLPFTAAEGRVVVSATHVDVLDARVTLPRGGMAVGRASLEKGRIEAQLRVAEVDVAAIHGALKPTRLSGTASIVSTGEGQRFEVNLADPRFAIEGRGAFADARLTLEAARLRHGSGALTATGTISTRGAREFRFEGRAEHFDPAAFAKVQPGDLNFAFVATGRLSPAWSGEAKLDFAPSRYAGLAAGGRVHVAGDVKRIANADVDVTLGEARLEARGRFGAPGDAMDVALHAPNLSVLAKPFGVALAGKVEGTARLTGTFAAPAGRVDLAGTNLALPGNVFLKELAVNGEAGVDPASRIDVQVKAGGVSVGQEQPPTLLAETAAVTVAGTRDSHRLTLDALLTAKQQLAGVLEGGLDPRAKIPSWSGRLQSLSLTGPSAFKLASPATLVASADRVELGVARLTGEWGEANFEVTRWTPRTLDLKGSSPRLAVWSTARALRLPEVRRSDLMMAAEWDVHSGETFDGRASLRRLSGDLRVGDPVLALGLEEVTVTLEAVRGRLEAVVDVRAQRVGRVQGRVKGQLVRGASGWEFSPSAPLDGHIVADVPNLELLAPWVGQEARLAGRLQADIAVGGSGRTPTFTGQARAEGLAVREPATGFEIDQGTLAIRIRDRAITIDKFEATAPWRPSKAALAKIGNARRPEHGRITAEGSIDLATRSGAIVVRAESLPVTQLQTRFVAISGEARLESRPEALVVTGSLSSDVAWIGALAKALPSVSEDVVVVRASQPPSTEPARPKDVIRLDLRASLGDHVYFQGRGLDTRLTGTMRLTGDVGALRASGAIRTVEGTYDGYGQKLAIERGTITFSGPLDNPSLSVLALRKGLPVEAGAEIYGTVSRPRVRLVSRPDVPEPEKLSWLVLGRSPAETSQGDASTLMAAARAMLGGTDPGSDLVKRFGFDEVRIGRPDAASALGALPQSTVAGKTGSASAADVVTVGKRITNDVSVIYEQGLADSEGALRVTWQITQKFQLLVRAGYLPGADAVWRWSFN